jgi:hypothetical protein
MDIKEQINKITDAVTKDASLKELFQKDPVKAVEKVLGVDLPDDVTEKIVQGVKGKISVDKVSGVADTLKKLF